MSEDSWGGWWERRRHHHHHKRIEGVQWSWNGKIEPIVLKIDRRFFVVASTQTLTSVGETATAAVAWLDQNGNAFTPAGATTVTSSDTAGAVATAVASADGLSAQFTAVANGSVVVTFSANNNEGAAVTATGVLTVAIPTPPPVSDLASGTVNWTQP